MKKSDIEISNTITSFIKYMFDNEPDKDKRAALAFDIVLETIIYGIDSPKEAGYILESVKQEYIKVMEMIQKENEDLNHFETDLEVE